MKSAPNLILVGPMGSGKSSIGRRLAQRLDLPFIDVDHEIERITGASIPLIFELEGEAGFRERERAVLARICAGHGQVIATGGGAVLLPANRELMPARGFVVHLSVTLDNQLRRLARDRSRPLLQRPDRRELLHQLAEERGPLYAAVADLEYDTGRSGVRQAVERLENLLRRYWRLSTPQPPAPDIPASEPRNPSAVHSAPIHRLDVELGSRRYPIRIGPGLLAHDNWPELIRGRHVLVISDGNVAPRYLQRVLDRLGERSVATFVLPAGEAEKNLSRFSEALTELARIGASRDATVLALGGGVVGDLAGFVAACWMRGIAFIQLPTTLLAMVDSSVGGKTAVDLPQGKNLVGAFHQPAAVIADTATLATLPARELSAGLAEVVKYGALGDAEFFAWLEAHAEALLAREPAAIATAIERSCRHKAAIVARDETEQGERALLNLGHSFGHALETADAYGGLLHGEAVAIGMVLAAQLSSRMGMAPAQDAERLATLLQHMNLPTTLPSGADPAQLLALMRLDKKNLSGRLRLILWHGLGRACIVPDVDEALVLAGLEQARADAVQARPAAAPARR